MKYLLSLCLVFLFSNLPAQSKWSVGLVGGADVFSRWNRLYIDPAFGELNSNSSLDDFGVGQRDLVRYGVMLGYQVNDKLVMRSGIMFTAQGEVVGSKIRWPSEYDDMGIYANDPNLPDNQLIQNKHRYIELPLRLRTYLWDSKIQWYIEGGISPSIYLSSVTQAVVDGYGVIEKSMSEAPWLSAVSVSFDLGFGTEIGIGEKVNVFVQPMIRHFPESAWRLLSRKGYNVGMELGCSFKLN